MAHTARRRLLAATVLGGALALAGCTFTNPIETLKPYAPSDGVRVEVTDGVRVENLLILAEAEGAEGRLLGAVVNTTTEQVEVTLTLGEHEEVVTVAGDDLVNLTDEEVTLPSTPAPPGGTVEAAVATPQHGTVPTAVPVLDGTLPPYDEYLPAG